MDRPVEEKCNHRGTEAQRYELSDAVIAAAIEVHRELGPGLLESVYELAMCEELRLRGVTFERQLVVPVIYKGVSLGHDYRIDLLIDDSLVVELKAVDALGPVHLAQVMTYLKLMGKRTGLLINFNHAQLRQGIKRVAL